MVRIESEDPTFQGARPAIEGLGQHSHTPEPVPTGAVAKFAQVDIGWLGRSFYLVRPVDGTDRLAILRARDGVFWSDDGLLDPLGARRQVMVCDPRGPEFRGRLYPRFLRTRTGQIVGDERHMSVFYGAGEGGWGGLAASHVGCLSGGSHVPGANGAGCSAVMDGKFLLKGPTPDPRLRLGLGRSAVSSRRVARASRSGPGGQTETVWLPS